MSSQFLSTESIFEVIGNYPVVDQFDVLYTGLLTGSYTDNYITGSMLSRTRNASGVGEILTPGNRRLAFSKLGVNRTQTPITLTDSSVETSYQLQPWWERSGIQRCVRIFSNNERFYDSLLPNVTKMLKVDGGQIAISAGLPFITIGHYSTGNDPVEDVRATGFIQSFPFEPKYSSIERVRSIASSFLVTYDVGVEPPEAIEPIFVKSAAVYEFYGENAPNGTNVVWSLFSNDFENPTTPPDNFSVTGILFGIGDRKSTSSSELGYPTGSIGMPEARKKAIGETSYLNGPIVRGWKYGVHDGNPHYTSCVFRRDKFGQLRDMLEQRLHPATLIDGENSPSTISLFAEEPTAMPSTKPARSTFSKNVQTSNISVGNILPQYPVTVNFVRQQINTDREGVNTLAYAQVSPNETWSSNMSIYATSSLPYFDFDNNSLGRNRGEIPQTVLNPEQAYTTV